MMTQHCGVIVNHAPHIFEGRANAFRTETASCPGTSNGSSSSPVLISPALPGMHSTLTDWETKYRDAKAAYELKVQDFAAETRRCSELSAELVRVRQERDEALADRDGMLEEIQGWITSEREAKAELAAVRQEADALRTSLNVANDLYLAAQQNGLATEAELAAVRVRADEWKRGVEQ